MRLRATAPRRRRCDRSGSSSWARASAASRWRPPCSVWTFRCSCWSVRCTSARSGAGLGVLPNAVRALAAIGVSEKLYAEAGPFRRFRICNQRGRGAHRGRLRGRLSAVGGEGYVMHRAALHAAISECVDPASVRLTRYVTSIEQNDAGVTVRVAGEPEPVSGDLARRGRRPQLGGAARRPRRWSTAIRRRDDLPWNHREASSTRPTSAAKCSESGSGRPSTTWEAAAATGGRRVPFHPDTHIAEETRNAYLQERFAGWPFGLPALFARTPSERILQNDIFDRNPVRTWHRQRVVLLGDAAHPRRPTWARARASRSRMPSCWLARSARLQRLGERAARTITANAGRALPGSRGSRAGGADSGLWKAAPLVWLRDQAYRSTPASWFERGMRDQYGYDAGALEAGSIT